ncbi:MAG: hypothetical protein KatS3mg076_3035 [Candidatus Binatia bacterium]|nr:MAG: hypothetical protein KatS3mg076_3035 [Candidatus Binatia bacterium]
MGIIPVVVPRVLTIGGSDSSGGAGIQADLKTFAALGVAGATVVTALTAQNATEVLGIVPVEAEFVRAQLRAVSSPAPPRAAKTGMLWSEEAILEVARWVRDRRIRALVVDPVMVAGSGARLLEERASEALVRELFPLACLVTPNLSEARALTGGEIRTLADMREAAKALRALGIRAVLLKGGHLDSGDAVDLYDDGRLTQELRAPRLPAGRLHGAGCVLSAAVASGLALGKPLNEAIVDAKRFVTRAIEAREDVGSGVAVVNPLWRFAGE